MMIIIILIITHITYTLYLQHIDKSINKKIDRKQKQIYIYIYIFCFRGNSLMTNYGLVDRWRNEHFLNASRAFVAPGITGAAPVQRLWDDSCAQVSLLHIDTLIIGYK